MRTLLLGALAASACATDDPPQVTGPHHTYVIDHVELPASQTEAEIGALDVDGDSKPDNRLGQLLAALVDLGFELPQSTDRAVARGEVVMLVDVQAEDLREAPAAGFELAFGADPQPAPCAGDDDPACGRHLEGDASFVFAGPRSGPLVGTIERGRVRAGPGVAHVAFALAPGGIAELPLEAARVELVSIDETGIRDGRIAGAITRETAFERFVPALHVAVVEAIARDCTACPCRGGELGPVLLDALDQSPLDCEVTLAELRDSPVMANLLDPDVRVDGVELLSLSLRFTAVPATLR